MIKTLLLLVVWALLGGMLGSWLGAVTGWALFSLGLLAMVLISAQQLTRVSRWARNLDAAPPVAVGPWDAVIAPIYRRLRRNRSDLTNLRQNTENMLQAAEALPDGALTLNTRMELTWCNQTARKHLGLQPHADHGHSIFNILRVPDFARYARQDNWPSPIMIHVHSGMQPRALLVHMTRYGVGDYLIVTRDVTKIERLETMRKDFVANVSHELRTPLTVLTGFLETLKDAPLDALDEPQRARYLSLMHEQALRMQATVADLLTLSALESTPHTNGKPIALARVIFASLDQAYAISAGNHQFDHDIDASLRITGVESELASAVANLITNAVHYTPAGGSITITWQRHTDGAVFAVRDTGIGIASTDIARLTERFYRADRGRSRSSGGTGLGLAITRHVALRHNAELTIDSRLGAGSVFSLTFPAERISANSNAA